MFVQLLSAWCCFIKSFRHWTTMGAVRGAALCTSIHTESLRLRLSLSSCSLIRLFRCSGESTWMRFCPLLQEFCFDYQGDYFMPPSFCFVLFCFVNLFPGYILFTKCPAHGNSFWPWGILQLFSLCRANWLPLKIFEPLNLWKSTIVIFFFFEEPKEEWNYSVGDSCKRATMYKIPLQLLEERRIKDTHWHNAPNPNKPGLGWICAYLLILLVCELPERSLGATVAGSKVKHEGLCPNKLNSNLWVDAQSTCERECNVDEVM